MTLTPEMAQAIRDARARVYAANDDAAERRAAFRATVLAAVEDGATQQSVADCLGLSRQRVYMLLAEAREDGLVVA